MEIKSDGLIFWIGEGGRRWKRWMRSRPSSVFCEIVDGGQSVWDDCRRRDSRIRLRSLLSCVEMYAAALVGRIAAIAVLVVVVVGHALRRMVLAGSSHSTHRGGHSRLRAHSLVYSSALLNVVLCLCLDVLSRCFRSRCLVVRHIATDRKDVAVVHSLLGWAGICTLATVLRNEVGIAADDVAAAVRIHSHVQT